MSVRHMHRHFAWAIATVALVAVLFTRESLPIWLPLALLALCPFSVLLMMREAGALDERLAERPPAEAQVGEGADGNSRWGRGPT
jgi:hypothetical protein